MSQSLLEVRHLVKHFIQRSPFFGREMARVQAVDDVSFSLKLGETLAIVGESGCGKSTLARCITKLIEPTSGQVIFQGTDVTGYSRSQMRPLRRDMMMVFQDPYGSLDPRQRVGEIIAEPLKVHRYGSAAAIKKRVQALLERVGLNAEHYNRFPHEFSGGQRQRVGVARALALEPKLVICDEPTSALDVSVQAQILNLLAGLQAEFGLTYIFITHNLDVVRHMADRVLVMYLGKIVEAGRVEDIFHRPRHPYTVSLLSAAPIPNPRLARQRQLILLEGDVPSPLNPPPACRFHPRCPRMEAVCAQAYPARLTFEPDHFVDCYFPVNSQNLINLED
ncbi:MAG: dipeptide ABC transporter ATP-binding protein [Anaerolineales bacterium]|nr:dipeptide ABC transporter ATP-binding protein [Anaerolineales bacterium]